MQDRRGPTPQPPEVAGTGIPFAEFVSLMALMIALTALSIDIMLPSLPQIGAAFSVAHVNDVQQMVTSYMIGLALGQLVWGPLSDRFGRKKLLLLGLLVFTLSSLACLFVTSFGMLLAARVAQGFGGASARVISIAIVRDLFAGRQMARVMSIVMMVFITVPIFAPTAGQALAYVGSWRWAFWVLFTAGVAGMVWAGRRLPETGHARDPGQPTFLRAVGVVLSTPVTVVYTIASGFLFSSLVSYISSAQQIFVEVYGLGAAFPLVFGALASSLAVASFINSRLVQRLGMRCVSHSALVGFVAASSIMAVIAAFGQPPVLVFGILLGVAFLCFGLIVPNFNAISMQPMARVAGMAASLIGFSTTAIGAVIGGVIGYMFNGTVVPLALGLASLGVLALASIVAIEGRSGLFRGE